MTPPSGSPRHGHPRDPVRGSGPRGGLRCVGVYERSVRASAERVWENVRDWEHLPWLHRASFSSIECIDSGAWGWQARIGLQPAAPGRSILLELRIEPDEPRYVSRTLDGAGAGSEIWTRVEERGEYETRVEVEFWLPDLAQKVAQKAEAKVAAKDTDARGQAFTNLYTRLWDEDEEMMIGRERALARQRGQRASGREPVRLGSLADVEARLPMPVEFGGERFRVVQYAGELVAHSVVCPHRLGPLHQVPVEGGRIVCPWHGYAFDLETGRECHGRSMRLAAAPRVRIDPGGEVWLLPGG